MLVNLYWFSEAFSTQAPKVKVPSSIDKTKLSQLQTCNTGTAARRVLAEVFQEVPNSLYNSVTIPRGASEKTISDAELAIQTKTNAKYSVMDVIELNGDKDADRATLALFCLFTASSISAIVTQQSFPGPEIIRFTIVWVLSFSPFFFVGTGIVMPASLQSALISLQRGIFPTYRKRMVHHEAGHFLIGHLLGFPIKNYQSNAVKNAVEFYPLNDKDVGRQKAALLGFEPKSDVSNAYDEDEYSDEQGFDKPFFSEGGRGDVLLQQSVFRDAKNYTDNPFLKVSPANNVKDAWPFRGFDHETLDKLAAVSVAGVCSEILGFGNAEGGFADLSQLRQLFANAEPALSEKDMDNRIRYAIGFSMGQLRCHLGALDALIEAMEADASVDECILVIETCKNVRGANVMNNYEKMRRKKIQNEGIGFIEKILLGGKNIDTEDDSIVYGKGGGDRKKGFQLTGDDPIYAALGVAFIFFTWASAGGLSLH